MTLFSPQPDPLEGFDAWWSLFPKDPRRGGKKSEKGLCQEIWRIRKLRSIRNQVIAAIKEDIRDIKKGAYARGDDRMIFFVSPKRWLNEGKYDRDVPEEPPQRKPKPVEPIGKPAMTPEEKRRLIPTFRKMAGMDNRREFI